MKFLEDTPPVVVILTAAKFRRDRENSRDAGLHFTMPLTTEVIKALPRAFQEQVNVMLKPNGVIGAELDVDVKHKTVRFFLVPEGPARLSVHDVPLASFQLERENKGSGADITLKFGIDVPLDRDTGAFIVETFGNQLWMSVEETQPELISKEE